MLATFVFVAPAGAHTGAALTFPHPNFTLKAAYQLTKRYQNKEGFPLKRLTCAWKSIHVAACEGTWTGTVLVNGSPETLLLVDWVTRAGGCSLTGRITHRPGGITVITGRHPIRNCFTGPLVVEVGPTILAT
jgi:hypothetical protein